MITKLRMKLQYSSKEKLTYQISSTMQGILMELVESAYAEKLHEEGLNPYQQYVSNITEKDFIWTICTLNKEAKEEIINVLLLQDKFYLKHKDLEFKVVEHELSSKGYDSLVEQYYFERQPRDITIRFISPTAFKSNGRYVFMPDVRLIFQSLMNKYDAFSSDTAVSDPQVLEHIENYCFIKKYNLKSVRFALEGVMISAFLGELTVHVNGPEQLVNLCNMLAEFGQYSGIGIKCSLGMGAIEIIRKEKR